jgi:stearoyl-CoA desaturase (delta-9 desaturase)
MSLRPGIRPEVEAPAARSRWRRINWLNSASLLGIHAGSLLVIFSGFSRPGVIAAIVVYATEIFGISAGYHRYFAHRSFKTSRAFQTVLAFLGGISAQMGPLWWSSYHRRHHADSDGPRDVHSPRRDGLLWAHIGWVLDENSAEMDASYVRDWQRFPELCWMDRRRWVPPLAVIAALGALGAWLGSGTTGMGAGAMHMIAWGYFLPTAVCYQVTFCVNSIAHRFGRRRYETGDDSRNIFWLALLTNGEGWHNNHHRFPSSEKHSNAWWEIDLTHYILRILAALGVVWGIRTPSMPETPMDPASSPSHTSA